MVNVVIIDHSKKRILTQENLEHATAKEALLDFPSQGLDLQELTSVEGSLH